jgi:multidrug efflux pump subunit AcrB
LAYYDLAPRLDRLPGVAETRIVGGRRPEYHVLVNPEKLNSYGLPLTGHPDLAEAEQAGEGRILREKGI